MTKKLILLIACAIAASSCSHRRARPNPRMGLIDDLKSGDHRSRSDLAEESGSSRSSSKKTDLSDAQVDYLKQLTAHWHWPLEHIHVTSPFGQRERDFHEGVDLQASRGTQVRAAQSGVVIYAGQKIEGYGKLVVIRHGSGLSSIYAHNSQLLVHPGQPVKRGQKIAYSGNTGRSTGPHLHFEIRKGVNALNPTAMMPRPGYAEREPASEMSVPRKVRHKVVRRKQRLHRKLAQST